MAVLKCKMCGGELNLEDGMTVAECEYCGSKQTVPTADNEKKMTLFARANRLRAANEFDKAAGVYESIVAEFPEEAEAYWGLVLCKYGIEYVDDPATGKKIPTCHRSSFDSVMDDSDFEQVMENADAIARRVYREEAKTIENIRKGILEVSSKEEPYDIFICYKETDEDGNRTIDSVIAQDIYKALTDEGYRVFFARISLEDKLGTAYEPYIFSALNSAKVMLAVGTDYDYYNAVWVKNEWSRFLALIAKGEKKTLIPCYKDIDAYDIPKEFKHLQAQDMGKVGAMQDLMRGIGKILGTKKQNTSSANVVADSNVSAMIQRGNMALEDSDFQNAVGFFERALDSNPKAAHAYLGKFLAFHRLTSLDDLQDKVCNLENNKEYKRAEQFADPELAKELKAIRESNELKIQRLRFLDVIRKALQKATEREKREAEKESKYIKACNLQASGSEQSLSEAAKEFLALKNYKDSAERANLCQQTFEKMKAEREARETRERAEREELERQERIEAKKRLLSAWKKVNQYRGVIAAGGDHTVGLKADGTVVAVGSNIIKSKFNKTRRGGQCDVNEWKDMIAVSAGYYHSVALRRDGTVDAVGTNIYNSGTGVVINDICNVSSWRNIKAISAGSYHTVGLQVSGTVVAVGDNRSGQCNVSRWNEIVGIAAGFNKTVGLKSDGTVVAVGENYHGACDVASWTDIVAVSTGFDHTVGLKADGTVVAVGDNSYGHCDVQGWKDIVAVSAGESHTVGLKADGTVVATKYSGDMRFYHGQCDVQDWKDIVAISAGQYHTVGLKADGTVVAVGRSYDGQCDVSSWKLFKTEAEKEADYVAAYQWQESGMLQRAADMYRSLKGYKDSKERMKQCIKLLLDKEKTDLQTELASLKGIFSGKRRKQIEARLAEIESELKRL